MSAPAAEHAVVAPRLESSMSPTTSPHRARDYAALLDRFPPEPLPLPPELREDRMVHVVDAAWEMLANTGVSWLGFYFKNPHQDTMTLGPRRDKPACSPIELYGVCGRCWYERRPIIVADVRSLGPEYIACDPRDRSEVVIPLLDPRAECYAVLDLDSYDPGAFEVADVIGLTTLLEHAGLSARPPAPLPIIRV